MAGGLDQPGTAEQMAFSARDKDGQAAVFETVTEEWSSSGPRAGAQPCPGAPSWKMADLPFPSFEG